MKILKNYKLTNNKEAEYSEVKLISGDYIYADMKIGMLDFEDEDKALYEFNTVTAGVKELVTRDKILEIISKTKIYHLGKEEGKEGLVEVEESKALISQRLPHGLDLTKLEIYNNEVVLIEKEGNNG